ncbi:hypothetical protein SAMN04515620_101127 [Collimonas sp. OK607]|uniref:hypothetical protein n=1 Tax=Collimonas sp. OK607 TaxID=1798194 RepID=UPI0008EC76BE|nr:hypothetical protein [Collimonas sp. OK607]SFA69726.1 hypothetical protein SAMN04515620_101127 [Collimonas sp. OK607]
MRRAMLLITLSLAVSCSAAVAAAPVFQLNTSEAEARSLLAIDAYPSNAEPVDSNHAAQTTIVSRAARPASKATAVFSQVGESNDSRRGANVIPVSFSSSADVGHLSMKASPSVNNSDDLLFYFLKDFEAKPQQKPGRWALLLVGLCFVLYQVRRRPMRTSIGFFSVSKPIGQFST